jgi:Uma2 family endonuclease
MIARQIKQHRARLPMETTVSTMPVVSIPASAYSPRGFREWAFSDDYPDRGRISYIFGEILVDMNAEALNTHALVKLTVTSTLASLAQENDWGQVFPDGSLITCEAADLSNEPDACFVLWESFESGGVQVVRDKAGEIQSLEGTVDWILEIVSNSSIRKDTILLREAYFKAGVPEYWLIDARREQIDFRILVRGKSGYVEQPRRGGWVASPMFERKFSLQRREYRGFWRYELLASPLGARRGS